MHLNAAPLEHPSERCVVAPSTAHSCLAALLSSPSVCQMPIRDLTEPATYAIKSITQQQQQQQSHAKQQEQAEEAAAGVEE